MKIFTSSKQLRKYYESQVKNKNSSQMLKKAVTVFEFENRAIISKNFARVSELERIQFLGQVISKTEKISNLKIESNISSLMNYIDYFITFFKELNEEKVPLEKLKEEDFYDDYKNHLNTLEFIFNEYKQILESNQKTDNIFIPLDYKIDQNYLNIFNKNEEIEFFIEGHFTKFQFEVFYKIAKIKPVYLVFYPNQFNERVRNLFIKYTISDEKFFDFNYEYKLQIIRDQQTKNNKKFLKIKSKTLINDSKKNINIFAFKNRLTQIAFIKYKIFEFIEKEKIDPSEVAIITLDEKFNPILKYFDTKFNFNFSAGFDLKRQLFYKIIFTYYRLLNRNSTEEKKRKSRIDTVIANTKNSDLILYSKKFFEFLELNWNKKITVSLFLENIYFLLKSSTKKATNFQAITDHFFKFFSNQKIEIQTKILMQYFIREFDNIKITDVKGGKITVLGLLETRGIKFKRTIVVDFNDSIFPKVSSKDMFINSEIKQKVELPTHSDREDLQKFYLYRLYQNSDKIFFTATENEREKISSIQHFFNQKSLKVVKEQGKFEKLLLDILYETTQTSKSWYSQFITDNMNNIFTFDFTKEELSNSKLKTYLECKTKFYFEYLLKISPQKDTSTENKTEKNIGSKIHLMIDKVLKKQKKIEIQPLINELNSPEYGLSAFQKRVWQDYFNNFYNLEQIRQLNYKYIDSEINLTGILNNIKLNGKIDKIEQNLTTNKYFAVDFKTGKAHEQIDLKNKSNYQLEFYFILMEQNNYEMSLEDMSFYYFKSGEYLTYKKPQDFTIRVKELKSKIKDLSIQKEHKLEKTSKKNVCNNCSYSEICK
jgi:CRISPR/Cas system-associated exonuclease Cas4 (RecB family)